MTTRSVYIGKRAMRAATKINAHTSRVSGAKQRAEELHAQRVPGSHASVAMPKQADGRPWRPLTEKQLKALFAVAMNLTHYRLVERGQRQYSQWCLGSWDITTQLLGLIKRGLVFTRRDGDSFVCEITPAGREVLAEG